MNIIITLYEEYGMNAGLLSEEIIPNIQILTYCPFGFQHE